MELRPMPTGACIHNTFLEFPEGDDFDSEQEDCLPQPSFFRRQLTDSALVRTCSSRIMLERDNHGALQGQAEKPELEPVPTEETLQPDADASDDQEVDSPSADSTSDCNSRQADERLLAARHVAARGGGLSGLLTVMIRHIPGRYTQQKLMREVNASGFLGKFDFFYVLMQPKSRLNRGFAFINFNTAQDAEDFYGSFHDQRLRHFHTDRPLEVMPADLQGFEANVEHYVHMLQSNQHKRPLQTSRALFFRQLPEHLAGLAAGGDDAAAPGPPPAKVSPALTAVPGAPGGRDATPQYFCTSCGQPMQPGHAFCTLCGARAPARGASGQRLQNSTSSAPPRELCYQ